MRIDWPSYAIEGTIALSMVWLFWCTWHGVDPVGWFR